MSDNIKNELTDFKRNWYKLMEAEEELKVIANKLYRLSSKPFKTSEEACYKRSPSIYKNNILELSNREEELKVERDYSLMHVRKVAKWLTVLEDNEVQLLHYRFFNNFSFRTIAKLMFTSRSNIDKRLKHIYQKIEKEC